MTPAAKVGAFETFDVRHEASHMGPAKDLGGTVRDADPAVTLERLKPLLADFGITRVADITGLDKVGIPVITAVRPLARCLSVSQGKGLTRDLAMVSGIMESIETFHAEQRRPTPTTRGLLEFRRDPAFVAPSRLTVRADASLDGDKPVAWIAGEDLCGGGQKWIPAELFNLDFSRRGPVPTFLSSSNGLASGNTRAEAIVHGLCEVVERDQTTFWTVAERFLDVKVGRRVMIETITDPMCRGLVDKCLAAGLTIFIFYITTNIDLPVFACTIADPGQATPYPQHAVGHGCHPIATIALARAITEAAQSRLTHIAGLREDLTWSRYRNEFPCDTAAGKALLARQSAQMPTIDFGRIDSESYRGPHDMNALLQHVLARLQAAGLTSAIAVDLAENSTFSVVFVCIPDAEHMSTKALAMYVPGARMQAFVSEHKRSSDVIKLSQVSLQT